MQYVRSAVALLLLISGAIVFASAPGVAPDNDFRKELRKKYEGKLLLLSVPSNFDVVHFDVNGSPTRSPGGEPWTTAGLVRADKVDVVNGQVVIDGRREVVALAANAAVKRPAPVTTERTVHVSIDLPQDRSDSVSRQEFLARILSTEEVLHRIEGAWRSEVDLSKGSGAGAAFPPDGKIGRLYGDR